MDAVTLVTNRLLLRAWRDEDLDGYAALNADTRVMEYYPKVLLRAESDASAERIRTRTAQRGLGLWAVEVPTVSSFIGYVGLAKPEFEAHFTPCIEIGWRLAFQHWGQGFATEAAFAVCNHAFGALCLDELVSFTVPENWRSRRVMEKLGMRRSPTDDFDYPVPADVQVARPHVLYRLGRRDWMTRNNEAEGCR